MTCIVGYIENENKVWIGGDSAAVSGVDRVPRLDSKVFKIGNFLIGCAGSFRAMQVVRFQFKPPKQKPKQDLFEYMCTDFVYELKSKMRETGLILMKDELHEHESRFLVATKGRLFDIDFDFQVGENIERWNAVGQPESYVMGAMKAMDGMSITPKEKIQKCLSIASHYSGAVCRPFNIMSI